MKDFIKQMVELIDEYTSNSKLTYKADLDSIVCYYDSEKFLEIDDCGCMYPINTTSPIDLNGFKNSESAYKIFYISELMLRGIDILNKE